MRMSKSQMMAPLEPDEGFAGWYVENILKVHAPEHYFAVSAAGRIEMTVNGRRHAESCGIVDIPSQMHFITLMWKLGAGFYRHPGFRDVAQDGDLDGPAKIAAFYEVHPDDAVHAIMNPDDTLWYSTPEARPEPAA